MSYNILGINPYHNGSVCVLSNGEIVYFIEEERLTKLKHDSNPFKAILNAINKYKIDEVVIAGINQNDVYLQFSKEDPFYSLIRKLILKNLPYISKVSLYHHNMHVNHSYFNSPFDECLGVVIDGGGSYIETKGIELDSIYICNNNSIEKIYSEFLKHDFKNPQPLNVARTYEAITHYLGFGLGEEGKVMGLSSYGKNDSDFSPLFVDNKSNPNFVLEKLNPKTLDREFSINFPTLKLHPKNNNTFTQKQKNLAWKVQNETQQLVGDYIEKAIKKTGLNQICCSGGYFLNCVANYYLIKRFPNSKFYFEPISSDAGTSIGASYFRWKKYNPNFKPKPQKTLYYGSNYSKKILLEGIKKYT